MITNNSFLPTSFATWPWSAASPWNYESPFARKFLSSVRVLQIPLTFGLCVLCNVDAHWIGRDEEFLRKLKIIRTTSLCISLTCLSPCLFRSSEATVSHHFFAGRALDQMLLWTALRDEFQIWEWKKKFELTFNDAASILRVSQLPKPFSEEFNHSTTP